MDKVAMTQRLVLLWTEAVDLNQRVVLELKPQIEPARLEAERVIEQVKRDLTKIDSGIEAQMGWPDNGNAAERQLDHLARTNLRSRAALVAARDADESWRAAVARQQRLQEGLKAATEFMGERMLKLIGP